MGADNEAFADLKEEYADVLGGVPKGMPEDRGMELVVETGDAQMWTSGRKQDRWKTSFRSQLGQLEWNVVSCCPQGSSSLLMRVVNQALTVGLDFPGVGWGGGGVWPITRLPTIRTGRSTTEPSLWGRPGGIGSTPRLGQCTLVYG